MGPLRAGGVKTSFQDTVSSTSADAGIKTGALNPVLQKQSLEYLLLEDAFAAPVSHFALTLGGLCLGTRGKEEAKALQGSRQSLQEPLKEPLQEPLKEDPKIIRLRSLDVSGKMPV